jgi:hypothetical protein
MKNAKTYRRRELLSYPRAQIKIILVFAVLALLFGVTNCYVSRNALQRVAERVLSLPLPAVARADVRITCEQELFTLDLQLMVFTFLSFFVLVTGSVYLSHKIAGPIFRLNRYLREMAQGKTSPQSLRFRKYDFFQDLADNFNEFQKSRGILPSDPKPPAEPGGLA